MTPVRTLEEMRREIDQVDRQLVALFEQRMALTDEVGRIKLESGTPVLDAARETQVLASRTAMLRDPKRRGMTERLYRLIMEMSRESQNEIIREARHD